jgi:hypothetical protein
MFLVFLPVTLFAVAGLGYTWLLTYREVRAAEVLARPQIIALLSESAVTAQALLFIVMLFCFIGPANQRAIEWIARLESLCFIVAVPCALIRKGPTRWWLSVSSLYFLALSGFGYLASSIQF